MKLKLWPSGVGDNGRWHRMYAWFPVRVENTLIWLDYYYWRPAGRIDYDCQYSKNSESQWGYKSVPEVRLEENMTEEDIRNAY